MLRKKPLKSLRYDRFAKKSVLQDICSTDFSIQGGAHHPAGAGRAERLRQNRARRRRNKSRSAAGCGISFVGRTFVFAAYFRQKTAVSRAFGSLCYALQGVSAVGAPRSIRLLMLWRVMSRVDVLCSSAEVVG